MKSGREASVPFRSSFDSWFLVTHHHVPFVLTRGVPCEIIGGVHHVPRPDRVYTPLTLWLV